MTKQIIETFPQNIEFDSVYRSFIQDILATLSIRIKVGDTPIEYEFFDTIECTQQIVDFNKESQLYIQSNSKALREVLNRATEVVSSEVDLSESKHYVWQIGDILFNIFAVEHGKEDNFIEVYREQEKVKQIIV